MKQQANAAPGGRDRAGHAVVHASGPVNWSREIPAPLAPAVDRSGRLPLNEFQFNRAGAGSPFGDDISFPVPPERLNYHHLTADEADREAGSAAPAADDEH